MKKVLLWAILAVAAVLAFCWRPIEVAVARVHAVYLAVKKTVVGFLKLAFAKLAEQAERLCGVVIVKLKTYTLLLARRARPEVTGSWRMCPST